jgi:hypothetical protein
MVLKLYRPPSSGAENKIQRNTKKNSHEMVLAGNKVPFFCNLFADAAINPDFS